MAASAPGLLGECARKACPIAHTERVSSRQSICPFWKHAGRERSRLPFRGFLIFHTCRLSSFRDFLISRASGFLRSVAERTREHAKRVPSRARSAFHRASHILHSVVRWPQRTLLSFCSLIFVYHALLLVSSRIQKFLKALIYQGFPDFRQN